jgi:response regulator RpfG family c-di-GMP phosphodiesterase
MHRTKPRVLIIDDDAVSRELLRDYLDDLYEIIETGESEQALKLTLEYKPSAILLDLSMPGFTGFELCKTLSSLSFTQEIPIFIVSGQDPRNKAFCESLGAYDYLQKPVVCDQLRARLAIALEEKKQPDRRLAPRTNTRLAITLRWKDKDGFALEGRTVTENVSATGFLCGCKVPIEIGTSLDVFVGNEGEHYMGTALVVRVQGTDVQSRLYGCHFTHKAETEAAEDQPQAVRST